MTDFPTEPNALQTVRLIGLLGVSVLSFWHLYILTKARSVIPLSKLLIFCNKVLIFRNKVVIVFLKIVYAMPCIPYLTPCHHHRAQEEHAKTHGNEWFHIHLMPNAQGEPRRPRRWLHRLVGL